MSNLLQTVIGVFNSLRRMDRYEGRSKFVKQYSWAVPCQEAITAIKTFVGDGTLLEIGSGTGLWAALMREAGVKVIATELTLTDNSYGHDKQYTQMEIMDCYQAMEKYADKCDVIMYCWPSYKELWTGHSLAQWIVKYNKNKVISIGEDGGGCTGDDVFNNIVCTNNEVRVEIPQWDDLHDEVKLSTLNEKEVDEAKEELQKIEELIRKSKCSSANFIKRFKKYLNTIIIMKLDAYEVIERIKEYFKVNTDWDKEAIKEELGQIIKSSEHYKLKETWNDSSWTIR